MNASSVYNTNACALLTDRGSSLTANLSNDIIFAFKQSTCLP